MSNPLVSVIVPNYNGHKYIDSTIRSVVNQTYTNWELIVVDDCSTDNSVDIVKGWASQYPDKIFLHEMGMNTGGPALPRDHGMSFSQGDYIAFLDSDDIWHPLKLAVQIQYMVECDSGFSCTKVCFFDDESELENINNNKTFSATQLNASSIVHSQMLVKNRIKSGSTCIVRKDLIEKYGIKFNGGRDYAAVEDYLFWLELMRQANISCQMLNVPLTFYRDTDSSISQVKAKMARKIFNLLKNYKVDGESLGWKVYYYFLTYAVLSVRDRLLRYPSRCRLFKS